MAENGNNSIRDRFSAQLGRHARSRAKKAEKAADPATLKSQLKAKDQEIFELHAQLLRNSQASIVHSSSAQDAAVAGSSRGGSVFFFYYSTLFLNLISSCCLSASAHRCRHILCRPHSPNPGPKLSLSVCGIGYPTILAIQLESCTGSGYHGSHLHRDC